MRARDTTPSLRRGPPTLAHIKEALPPDLSATLKVLGWRTWCCCSGISMCSFSICIIFSSKSAMRSSVPPSATSDPETVLLLCPYSVLCAPSSFAHEELAKEQELRGADRRALALEREDVRVLLVPWAPRRQMTPKWLRWLWPKRPQLPAVTGISSIDTREGRWLAERFELPRAWLDPEGVRAAAHLTTKGLPLPAHWTLDRPPQVLDPSKSFHLVQVK